MTSYDLERLKAAAFDILTVLRPEKEALGSILEAMELLIRVAEAEQENPT